MRKNKLGEFFQNFLGFSTHHMMNVAVVLVLLLMMAIVIHSVSRYLFAKSLLWIMEACAFAFMAIVFLALGSTQRLDRHIKVDVLESLLPKQVHYRLKGLIAPGIALVYVLIFCGVLGSWHGDFIRRMLSDLN